MASTAEQVQSPQVEQGAWGQGAGQQVWTACESRSCASLPIPVFRDIMWPW